MKQWFEMMSERLISYATIAIICAIGAFAALVATFVTNGWNFLLFLLMAFCVLVMLTSPDEEGRSLLDVYKALKSHDDASSNL